MAMPTSAAASAGASLMPSPTIATASPSRAERCDRRGLVARQHLGAHVVDAERLAPRPGAPPRLSPVSMHGRAARARAAARRACAPSASSASPKASRPSTRGAGARLGQPRHGAGPRLQRAARVGAQAPRRRPSSRAAAAAAQAQARGRRRAPATPRPGNGAHVAAGGGGDRPARRRCDHRARQRMLAALLQRGGERAAPSRAGRCRGRSTSVSAGLPFGQRAGLVERDDA